MQFRLELQPEAKVVLTQLQQTDPKKYQKVLKTLGLMQTNLRHPSLNTHKYESLIGPKGEEIFEAYVENKTPAAFKVFWHCGPGQGIISILTITPHP